MSNNTVNNSNNNSNGYASNNNFDGCPALMSDGRFLTSYKPNCEMNKKIENTFNKNIPMTSWEYKYHLTNNADKVMGFINNNNKNQYGCSGYGYQVPQPSLKQDCKLDNCVINNTGNNNGIGLY